MLQQVLHKFEEVGLEPLDYTLKEVDVKLRDGLTVNVVSTPLYDCACLKYVYANPVTGDEQTGIVYWPASGEEPASGEPVVDDSKEYTCNLWPFDHNAVITVLDLDTMLMAIKLMLP